MSVNEYVTKFTQMSHYAPCEVDTVEKKQDYFLNVLNDGLTYAMKARDFENFQGMVNKALVLENHKGVMERKRKLVCQHQPSSSSRPRVGPSSAGPMFRPAQPQFQPMPQVAGQGLSTSQRQVIQCPNNLRLLLLEVRMFRGPKLPKTCCKLIVGASTVVKRDIIPTDAPIRALVLINPLQLHLPLPVEPIRFQLPPSRTMLVGESTMLMWRKPKKLQTLSLVCFSSMTLLQLCYLIMEHHILSYLLHMLGSIICP
jgi:hypothetical protein